MIGMAKSDSFFIRAKTAFNGTTYTQSSIDLGAYVDALGKSVLRIHNISVQWGTPLEDADTSTTNAGQTDAFQLTTQSQAAMVDLTNKSVIASGRLSLHTDGTAAVVQINDELDVAPQHWTDGYLVGVEQIYLGVDSSASDAFGLSQCAIMLECTVETLSSSAAMALALSQQ